MQRREFMQGLAALGISIPFVDLATCDVNIPNPTELIDEDIPNNDPLIGDSLKLIEPKPYKIPYGLEELNQLIRETGSPNREISLEAVRKLAKMIEDVVNRQIRTGNINSIFTETLYLPETPHNHNWCMFSLEEGNAYVIPNHGRVPNRHTEGDYVMVPNYDIGASIDWRMSYSRDARWDVIARAIESFAESFRKKIADDAWHVLLCAALDRNRAVSPKGTRKFHINIIDNMKAMMEEEGNVLTHAYLGEYTIKDWYVRNYGEEAWKKTLEDGFLTYKGVEIHLEPFFDSTVSRQKSQLNHLSDAQLYLFDELNYPRELKTQDFVLGLDLSKHEYPFYITRPSTTPNIMLFDDMDMHRRRRCGIYGWGTQGISCLNNKHTILGVCDAR